MMQSIKPIRVKRFGQHFLHQASYLNRIITEICIQPSDCFIEVGPGGGALTEYLLPHVKQLIAIEIDRELYYALQHKFQDFKEKFQLYQANALEVDVNSLNCPNNTRMRMIGNLPYNVATPILFHFLKDRHRIKDFHVMLQKEVADRLTARVCEKAYSRFTVMMQYYCTVKRLFTVSAGAFTPPPRVESAFVRLEPWSIPPLKAYDEFYLEQVVRLAFSQKRKFISNSLKNFINCVELEKCHINPRARPQELSVLDYVKIANYLYLRDFKNPKEFFIKK